MIDTSVYQNTITRIDSTFPIWNSHNEVLKSHESDYNKAKEVYDTAVGELRLLKAARDKLNNYYVARKQETLHMLERNITGIVNSWFNNNYNFAFQSTIERGKTLTELVDTNKRGTLQMICGDGVQQTLGVLFSVSFVKSVSGEFIFFDEAFNSLGIEEVERLPDVLAGITDLQLVMIEHKCELLDNNYAATIHITRNVNESSTYEIIDPNGFMQQSINELQNIDYTLEDIQIAKTFGVDMRQVLGDNLYNQLLSTQLTSESHPTQINQNEN